MYEITTAIGFTGPRRRRAGIEVAQGATVVVELTEEQLEAIQEDPCLVVTEVVEKSEAKSLTKAELLEIAKEIGIEVPSKATVAQIKELIETATGKAEADAGQDTTQLVDEPSGQKDL